MEVRGFPWITAHAGCMNFPDHTLRSIEAGIAAGADIIEEDVRVTADGVPVLAHDHFLHTAGDETVDIATIPYRDLAGMAFVCHRYTQQTFQLLKLETLLQAVKRSGRTVNLDLKEDAAIEPAAHAVQAAGMAGQAFFSGCEHGRALLARKLAPGVRRLLNADAKLFLRYDYEEAAARTIEHALNASAAAINIYYQFVQPQFIERAHPQGVPVFVWTLNEPEEMRRMIRLGVASITTRNVEALVELQNEAAAEREGDADTLSFG